MWYYYKWSDTMNGILIVDKDKDYTIAINVYSQALTFSYYKKEEGAEKEQTYSIDVFHNGYIIYFQIVKRIPA